MKRAIVLAILAATLAFAPGAYAFPNGPCAPTAAAYAYPNGPCAPPVAPSTASGLSQAQLFLLVLPALINAVA